MWRAHTEEGKLHGKIVGALNKGRPSHRKGLTKENSEEIRKTSEKVKNTVRRKVLEGIFVPNIMSKEARRKLSVDQSIRNRGGKCKWFEYNGQKVQGTWELNVAKKLDEMNIKWKKLSSKKDVIGYVLNGKEKSYTPDFYLEEYKLYLEIKGYWWGNDKEKMQAVREQAPEKNILIIEKEQYKKILRNELVW